jgi:hypothetical protein
VPSLLPKHASAFPSQEGWYNLSATRARVERVCPCSRCPPSPTPMRSVDTDKTVRFSMGLQRHRASSTPGDAQEVLRLDVTRSVIHIPHRVWRRRDKMEQENERTGAAGCLYKSNRAHPIALARVSARLRLPPVAGRTLAGFVSAVAARGVWCVRVRMGRRETVREKMWGAG